MKTNGAAVHFESRRDVNAPVVGIELLGRRHEAESAFITRTATA